MQSLRLSYRPLIGLLAVALILFVACGGGGGGDDSVIDDLDTIPTATPPAVLPDVLIVGQNDAPISGGTYTVQDGDTLLAIADQFGTTVDAIINANEGLDASTLQVGQEITIPGLDDGSDVLGSTAQPQRTSTPRPVEPTDEPLPTDTPEPVDEPTGDCEGGHVVQEGEFPDNIAPIYGITVEELMAANPGIDPTALQIGDCLLLP